MTSQVEHLQTVLSNHESALAGEDAAGVASNYDPKAILIVNGETFIGRAAIQGFYERLIRQLPQASWETERACFAGDLAYVEWSCRAGSSRVPLGVDTFVVGPAGIVRQTAWFCVISAG
jgi:ketosteroid isomerase-like protein